MVLVSAFAISGCATDDAWTPMSAGRTAGDSMIVDTHTHDAVKHESPADEEFNSSLRK